MEWYERFFGERYLSEYAAVLTDERTLADVEGVIALLGLPEGSRILDLCCGHGRHSVELAARGYDVFGQDLCALFLEKARGAAEARGVTLTLARGDMREIAHEPGFDAVVNLFTAFGYFEDDRENAKVIREVARVLRPGGKFVLEIIDRDGLMTKYQPKDWTVLPDGTAIFHLRSFDAVAGINWEEREYRHPDGAVERDRFGIRIYTPTELAAMLREAGLEVVSVTDGFGGGPLKPNSFRMVLLARKPD